MVLEFNISIRSRVFIEIPAFLICKNKFLSNQCRNFGSGFLLTIMFKVESGIVVIVMAELGCQVLYTPYGDANLTVLLPVSAGTLQFQKIRIGEYIC